MSNVVQFQGRRERGFDRISVSASIDGSSALELKPDFQEDTRSHLRVIKPVTEIAESAKITPIRPGIELEPNSLEGRPLRVALQEVTREALMPRSEAPDPVILERLATMPIAPWLNYRPNPNNLSYAIGRPLEMLRVPASDAEAERIRGKSNANYTKVISTEEVMSKADALNNGFSFFSMYSKDAGNSFAQTSILSQAETWDKQSDGIRNVAVDVLEAVGGTKDVVWVCVGDNTIVGFIRGKRDMQVMAEQSVIAPIAAYKEYLPHLAQAQEEIQIDRLSDVLDPENGSARKWIDVKKGKRDGMKRAWDDSPEEFSKLSFWFASEQIKKDGILKQQGIGIDNEPITWEKLALESPELAQGDTTTRDLMLTLDRYFSGGDIMDRHALVFTWKDDTGCCGESFSSLNSEEDIGTSEMNKIQARTSINLGKQNALANNLLFIGDDVLHSGGGIAVEDRDYCDTCHARRSSEGKCSCHKS